MSIYWGLNCHRFLVDVLRDLPDCIKSFFKLLGVFFDRIRALLTDIFPVRLYTYVNWLKREFNIEQNYNNSCQLTHCRCNILNMSDKIILKNNFLFIHNVCENLDGSN
jgi:hypothetical protein